MVPGAPGAWLLGPWGWFALGPTLADGASVRFDPADCSAAVVSVDLRAEQPGLALVRVHDADGWRFLAEAPPGGTVLRDAAGAYVGSALGAARVGLVSTRPALSSRGIAVGEESIWQADGGSRLTLRWEEGALAAATGPHGTTRYGYTAGALTSVRTGDGAVYTVARSPGRTVVGTPAGEWRCTLDGPLDASIVGPGQSWRVEGAPSSGTQRVTDPAGRVTETRWSDGRLIGWTDPAGARTTLTRADGRVTGLAGPAGAWTFGWDGAGRLLRVTGASAWSLSYDAAGRLRQLSDGLGRLATWSTGLDGLPRAWGRGSPKRSVDRDDAGRVVSLSEGGRILLQRDRDGHIVGVVDGAGGRWSLGRGADGRVTEITDPGGGQWLIGYDEVGRPASVGDPVGRTARLERGPAGVVGVTVEGQTWSVGRDAAGRAVAVVDPWGRRWRVTRDALGRPTRVERPDQSEVRLVRGPRGDLLAADNLTIERDAAGLPVGWARGAASGAWRWGPGGLVEARGPGVRVGFERDAVGQIAAVLTDGARWTLARDERGAVVGVDGPGAVTLVRDSAGRVTALDGPAGALRVDRDGRGLVARVRLGDRAWVHRRDAAGRLVGVESADGVRLGVDRDGAGRPLLARFTDGTLARYVWDRAGVGVMLQDPAGALVAVAGWTLDGLGRVTRLRGETPVLLQRDPLGELVVQEGAEVWSQAPDRAEGPDGAALTWDHAGRPAQGRVPASAPPAWGVADAEVRWTLAADGSMASIHGARGSVALVHDALGRLARWSGPGGVWTVERDALGRLVSVGPRREALGWGGLLAWAGASRATIPDVGQARPGGGVLLDARGVPLLVAPLGAVSVGPTGLPLTAATGELGSGGRFQPVVGGPLLGRADAIDPVSGQPTAAPWTLSGTARPWEVQPGETPWPDPDDHADVPWDPAPFAAEGPFDDPLALLVGAGELPDGGPRASRPPGLPWLPASLAPGVPLPVPDPDALAITLDPVEAWVLGHARAPVTPASPGELLPYLLSVESAAPYGVHTGGALGSGMDTVTAAVLLPVSSSRSW